MQAFLYQVVLSVLGVCPSFVEDMACTGLILILEPVLNFNAHENRALFIRLFRNEVKAEPPLLSGTIVLIKMRSPKKPKNLGIAGNAMVKFTIFSGKTL